MPSPNVTSRIVKTRVRSKFQITIPEHIRQAYALAEGQYLNVRVTPEGILLSATKEIDSQQTWFWTPRWQAMEREANADFQEGRVITANSAAALFRTLKRKESKR